MKHFQRLSLLGVLLMACCMVSCYHKDSLPEGVIDDSTMVEILTQAYMIEGFYAIESGFRYANMSKETDQSYQKLLDSFHVSRADFDSSICYYSRHKELDESIHQRVLENLEKMPY